MEPVSLSSDAPLMQCVVHGGRTPLMSSCRGNVDICLVEGFFEPRFPFFPIKEVFQQVGRPLCQQRLPPTQTTHASVLGPWSTLPEPGAASQAPGPWSGCRLATLKGPHRPASGAQAATVLFGNGTTPRRQMPSQACPLLSVQL